MICIAWRWILCKIKVGLQSNAKPLAGTLTLFRGPPTTHQILVAEEIQRECCVISAVVLI